MVALLLTAGMAADPAGASATSCDQTTELVARSCAREAEADQLVGLANCANIGTAGDAARCVERAGRDLRAAQTECGAQRTVRVTICGALGQAPYDPPIDPANFVRQVTNRYFPLKPGTVFTYRGEDSVTTVRVTDRTRKILGVDCTVVRDTVFVDGRVEEDTYDYFAQDRQGNVWYFGEDTAEYVNGLVVSIDGSFIAGEKGAKPGLIMAAAPAAGTTYRQEFALGEAEDVGRYESRGGRLTLRSGTYKNVVKTFDYTPLEPGAKENKYYAPQVGLVATVNLVTGEREELISVEP
jgi:hypothetical protein